MDEEVFKSNRARDIEAAIDAAMESDAFYQAKATPLKSAELWKKEHRQELQKKFEFQDFTSKIRLGFLTIADLLPKLIGIQAYSQVVEEFVNRKEHPLVQVTETKKLCIQEEWSISLETMDHIYQLGRRLMEDTQLKEADAVFTVLSYLNPKIPEFSLGKCMALFNLGEYEEAIELLQLTKILQPQKPAPFIYSALCNQKLNHAQELEEDFTKIEEIFSQSEDERQNWEPLMQLLKTQQEV